MSGVAAHKILDQVSVDKVSKLADWCVENKLTLPVLLLLESHLPLRGLMSFSVQFFQPLFPGVFEKLSPVLDDRAALDALIVKLREHHGS
jgi:hypothetical protein